MKSATHSFIRVPWPPTAAAFSRAADAGHSAEWQMTLHVTHESNNVNCMNSKTDFNFSMNQDVSIRLSTALGPIRHLGGVHVARGGNVAFVSETTKACASQAIRLSSLVVAINL